MRTSPGHPPKPSTHALSPQSFVEVRCWRRAWWWCLVRCDRGTVQGHPEALVLSLDALSALHGLLAAHRCGLPPVLNLPTTGTVSQLTEDQTNQLHPGWSSRLNTSGCRVQGCSLHRLETNVIRAMVMIFNNVQNSCFTTNTIVGKRALLYFPASGIF